MKNIKLISILTLTFIVLLVMYESSKIEPIDKVMYKQSDETTVESSPEEVSKELAVETYSISTYASPENISLLVKFIFSIIFTLAALRIIMGPKEKYDDTTRQWAFSILALISGVWIGTAV